MVVRDADYINWILENPNISVSQTLKTFLGGAVQCVTADKNVYISTAYMT